MTLETFKAALEAVEPGLYEEVDAEVVRLSGYPVAEVLEVLPPSVSPVKALMCMFAFTSTVRGVDFWKGVCDRIAAGETV